MLKTYHGSCHCGRVRYEADLDLSAGSTRCNCSICTKVRTWTVLVKPEAFRLLQGADALADYQFGGHINHNRFCETCGVRTHFHGTLPELGGPFVTVLLATLDDTPPEALIASTVTYVDGRNDAWWNPPAETRHL